MNSNELARTLEELSALRSAPEPIASLYLDTRWADERQRERVRVFVRERVKADRARYADSPAHEAVRRTLARVEEFALALCGRATGEADRGAAVFACESLGLWRPLGFRRPFENALCLDSRPHLLQLARLADGVEPAIVAVVHADGAQLYEVALGAIVTEAAIEGPIPRVHREREARSARHLEVQVRRLWRAAVDELARLFDAAPTSHVVLVGTSEVAAAFERELPERVRAAVRACLPGARVRRGGSAHGEVIAQAARVVEEEERRSETRRVDEAVDRALQGGGLAVLGPEDVVLAANERRVRRLVIEEDFGRAGWRCQSCDAIGITHSERCPYCEGILVTVLELEEELVARVLAEDGEIEVVAHSPRLHSYDGVAALLRQARGAGATPPAPA